MLKSLALLAAMAFGTGAWAEDMKMAVTTSFANSGLAEVLLPVIEKDTGITVQLLVVGTGQALALGAAGDVDAVLVHSRAAEDKWLAEGNGTHRREIMYNDFVIVGPATDPAATKAAANAIDAFKAIAAAQTPFVSRGDDSGTHKMEQALWATAGIEPSGDWYRSVGQGMGAALNTAAGMNAYILADRASWLNFGNKADLAIDFEGDPALFNQYAYLPVNPVKHPHVKTELVQKLEDWLVSDTAKGLIEGYKIADQQLFVFNAKPE
ncbi:substrate-binding domain-containing protein [Pseudorhodobacter sp. W20_MBD10_FR17]|uniref:substrate-binding domain-containing protein n=1 Tax=Pseudorhodobacter sp. W20_MBD10_FR17 TaxID=3240266 RepID=UPI003F9A7F42